MHVAILTAGGAGMFCGSCMHDNTWARALMQAGAQVTLIPTYTPLRVDEQDVSTQRVFLGGINVYLDYRSKLWRRLPRWMTGWLDHPGVIRLATRFGVTNDAAQLGELTLAVLDGEHGPQHREIDELVNFIATDVRPDVVCFSNALLVGALGALKRRFTGPVFCTLQGDDIFLDSLPDSSRLAALERLSTHARQFDGFLVHSRYYRDFMSHMLGVPVERFACIPLGIELAGHDGTAERSVNGPVTVGYFARICPEKGLHQLVDAFKAVHRRHPHTRLVAGGYLGPRDGAYFRDVQRSAKPLGDAFEYAGSPPDHDSKVKLLKRFDLLSVPTVYREPKGIYVLEALANGVPVVQPAHGAFVEMLEATGGGLLCAPQSIDDLSNCLEWLVSQPEERLRLGRQGQRAVRSRFDAMTMARASLEVFGDMLAVKAAASSGAASPDVQPLADLAMGRCANGQAVPQTPESP